MKPHQKIRERTLTKCHLLSAVVFVATLILLSLEYSINAQFISHINARGLRGNFTFDIKQEANGSVLVIESLIKADQSRWIQGQRDGEEVDSSLPILFEWSLHLNTLEPHMLATCSNDDLGPTVPETLRNSFLDINGGGSSNTLIALDKVNRWTVPLTDVLLANEARSLSSLIWGKSIRLKLSSSYGERSDPTNDTNSGHTNTSRKPITGTQLQGPSRPGGSSSSGISRPQLSAPQLTGPAPVSPAPASKPTFAPRPKPSISAKFKTPAPALPKPEALIMEGGAMDSVAAEVEQPVAGSVAVSPSPLASTSQQVGTSSNSSAAVGRDIIVAATNKRILKMFGNIVVCANIIDTRQIKTAEAVFESQVAGRVTIRGNEDDTSLLMLNLYHIRSKVTTRHDWKIMASDILDSRRDDEKCKYLQVLFDPNNLDDSKCRKNDTTKCRMGDLTRKHGQIQVAGQGRSTRATLVDLNLPLSALESSRSLFLVIYEVAIKSSNNGLPSVRPNVLSCAQIKSVGGRRVEATFNMDGVRGTIRVSQRHASEPATLSYDLFGLEGNIRHQTMRELPLAARASADNSKLCNNLGEIFNPTKKSPWQGGGSADRRLFTIDSYQVGNLSAKHGPLSVIDSEYEDHYMGEYLDLSLQLYGHQTIVGRSILLHKNNGDPWVCASLNYIEEPIAQAVATFHYPAVGRILFQQLAGDSHAETGVLVEVYNPNSEKSSENHNWLIHLKPAMADFYNWSQRCESAGEVYDPILASIGLSNEVYTRQCHSSVASEPLRCRTGDTSVKGGFRLALPTSAQARSRHYYTDLFLPISGAHSIIGRSVVIYDEHAPTQRGNRLACATIRASHPLRASVRSWNSGPSIPSAVRGSMVFEQESATKETRIKLDLDGFNGNVENYAIHNVWTMEDREFPCSNDSLYDIYDPYDTENSQRLPPSAHYGALATVDRVRVGDLSRKHGTLEGLQAVQRAHQDANAPLFAPRSIVGRSVVLRAAVNDFRWVCGNIELDYDKGTSRELVGLASFDEPRSKVSGYVRLVQLEHRDGSLSDTYIQVDLRLQSDGVHELQTSADHNWAIFVNQVGEDAFIAADDVRCIASGFKWNPYLAQDNLDTYTDSCSPAEPLGCAMGDLGKRHGPLTLGPNNRRSLSDSNVPLAGNYSVMGRSLIVFDNKRPSVKLACANIFPDIHLKSNVVIKRTPSFTVARFVEQMRSLLGAADWLMVPELRATKPVANGECVQMTIHFYGQKAHQMQVELNNLITLGTVRKSTRLGSDKISTHYKLCRAGQKELISGGGAPNGGACCNHYLLLAIACFICALTRNIAIANHHNQR